MQDFSFCIETLKNSRLELILIVYKGSIVQLEERFACTEEASGSSPDRSTNFVFYEFDFSRGFDYVVNV